MNSLDLGSGPALLFLHGAGICAAAYRPLFLILAKRFRVLAPDLPGTGPMPLPNDHPSLDDYASEVRTWLDTRGVKPEAIVGHSLGGGVALSLAEAQGFPRKLVLIDSVGAGSPRSATALVARFFLLKNLNVLLRPSRWPAVWRVLPFFLGSMGLRLKKILRIGRLALRAAKEPHRALELPESRPVFVSATGDELFPPSLYHDCAARHPGARVVEVAGGHDWCVLQPESAAALLMSILEDSPAK